MIMMLNYGYSLFTKLTFECQDSVPCVLGLGLHNGRECRVETKLMQLIGVMANKHIRYIYSSFKELTLQACWYCLWFEFGSPPRSPRTMRLFWN